MISSLLPRYIVAALFTTVAAGTWDAWWHGALGRESFWSPPHILLYTSVLLAITLGIYGWYRTRERLWRRLAIFLALVPASAPFDELWHRTFGIETPASPIIVWSPPHVILIAAVAGSLLLLLPVLRKDENRDAQRLFGSLIFASTLILFMFLAAPLQPTGPYELIGFWGAGVLAAIFVGVLLAARTWIPGIGGAVTTALAYITILSISLGERIASGVNVPPHEHAPPWLLVFSIMIPALFIDLFPRLNGWMRGMIAGLMWSLILYGVAWMFFAPRFQYSLVDGMTGIIASAAGGLFAGFTIKPRSTSELIRVP